MDRNYELFRIATSAVREMKTRMSRVFEAGTNPSFVAYHAAELAEHANKAHAAQEMLRAVLAPQEISALYEEAWKHVLNGDSDELTRLFIEDARKGL